MLFGDHGVFRRRKETQATGHCVLATETRGDRRRSSRHRPESSYYWQNMTCCTDVTDVYFVACRWFWIHVTGDGITKVRRVKVHSGAFLNIFEESRHIPLPGVLVQPRVPSVEIATFLLLCQSNYVGVRSILTTRGLICRSRNIQRRSLPRFKRAANASVKHYTWPLALTYTRRSWQCPSKCVLMCARY